MDGERYDGAHYTPDAARAVATRFEDLVQQLEQLDDALNPTGG